MQSSSVSAEGSISDRRSLRLMLESPVVIPARVDLAFANRLAFERAAQTRPSQHVMTASPAAPSCKTIRRPHHRTPPITARYSPHLATAQTRRIRRAAAESPTPKTAPSSPTTAGVSGSTKKPSGRTTTSSSPKTSPGIDGMLCGKGQPLPVNEPTGGWGTLTHRHRHRTSPSPPPSSSTTGASSAQPPLHPRRVPLRRTIPQPPPTTPSRRTAPTSASPGGHADPHPRRMEGKRIFLHIRGARLRAEVYLNQKTRRLLHHGGAPLRVRPHPRRRPRRPQPPRHPPHQPLRPLRLGRRPQRQVGSRHTLPLPRLRRPRSRHDDQRTWQTFESRMLGFSTRQSHERSSVISQRSRPRQSQRTMDRIT